MLNELIVNLLVSKFSVYSNMNRELIYCRDLMKFINGYKAKKIIQIVNFALRKQYISQL